MSPGPVGIERVGAVDVHYFGDDRCRAAVVVGADVSFDRIVDRRRVDLAVSEPYVPGELYRRELPPIRSVVDSIEPLGLLIVDGYVTLDPIGRPGLGAHAHDALGIPVVGVAKTAFRGATHAIEVRRGTAVRPLYVTAIGVDAREAASWVESMPGAHRLPEALRLADRLARGLLSA